MISPTLAFHTPDAIRQILSAVAPDCADVLVTIADEAAIACRDEGCVPHGTPYDIATWSCDREAAEELLGRKLDAAETEALETCIRWHLDQGPVPQ